jgi:hypothetical protein
MLFGNEGSDLMVGNYDPDLLIGGQGFDTLYGGKDNDTLYGNQGVNELLGGSGADIFAMVPSVRHQHEERPVAVLVGHHEEIVVTFTTETVDPPPHQEQVTFREDAPGRPNETAARPAWENYIPALDRQRLHSGRMRADRHTAVLSDLLPRRDPDHQGRPAALHDRRSSTPPQCRCPTRWGDVSSITLDSSAFDGGGRHRRDVERRGRRDRDLRGQYLEASNAAAKPETAATTEAAATKTAETAAAAAALAPAR